MRRPSNGRGAAAERGIPRAPYERATAAKLQQKTRKTKAPELTGTSLTTCRNQSDAMQIKIRCCPNTNLTRCRNEPGVL